MRYPRLLFLLALSALSFFTAASPGHAQRVEEYLPTVIAQIAGQDANTRTNAIRILAALRAEAGVPALINVLTTDTNPMVRTEAATALGKIGSRQAIDPLLAALKDEFVFVRAAAIQSLGRLKDQKALPALLAEARETTSDIRPQALTALGMIGTKEAVDTLLAAVADPEADIRQLAITGLARCRDERAIDPLITLLRDPDAKKRLAAAKILTQYRSPKTVDALMLVLRDQDSQVRAQAATALGLIGDTKAMDALTIALLDKTVTVRCAAATALGRFRDPSLINPLIGCYGGGNQFGDQESNMSTVVMTALRRIGPPAIEALLADAKPGADPAARQTALAILGAMHEPRAIDDLLAALDEKDYRLRNQAQNGLTGRWPWGRYGSSDTSLFMRSLDGPPQSIAFGRPEPVNHAWCQSAKVVDVILPKAQAQQNNLWYPSILTTFSDPRVTEYFLERYTKNPKDTMLPLYLNAIDTAQFLDARLEMLKGIQAKDESGKWQLQMEAMAIAGMRDLRDISPIIAALQNDNAEVRKALIAALGRIGDVRAVDPLINLLQTDLVPEVREYAALSLGLLHEAKAVPALITALGDDVEWARSAAAWALGEIGDTRAIAPLQQALKRDDPRFNVRVACALWQLQADKHIEKYLSLLSSVDRMTRDIAASSLGDIDGAHSVEAFMLALGNQSSRYATLDSLNHHWNPYALGPILDTLDEPTNEQDDRHSFLFMACNVLGTCGDTRAIEPLADLLRNTNDESVQAAAAGALARLGDLRGIEVSLANLSDLGGQYHLTAILGLQSVKDPRVDSALAIALDEADPLIKAVAAHAVALRGDARGAETLIVMAKAGQDTIVQKLVLQYLGEAKDKRAVPTLLQIAQQGILEDRMGAITALGMIGDTSVLPSLLDILRQDDNPRVKVSIARALGGFKDPAVLQSLIGTQRSPYSDVRVAGVEGLGKYGTRDGINALITALGDEATRVRSAAARSLTTITGQQFGEDAAKWRTWAARR